MCIRDRFSAVGAAGMILDARTGEIVAMVSLPDFDPHRPGAMPPENRLPVQNCWPEAVQTGRARVYCLGAQVISEP